MKNKDYRPITFFIITFFITWTFWFIASAFSFQNNNQLIVGILMGIGLLGPFISSMIMIFSSKDYRLRQDFKNKLMSIKLISLGFIPIIIFLMPSIIILSILISVPFGGSINQLNITSDFNIMKGAPLLSMIIPFLAPALEELGWSGYGIDSLRSKFNTLHSTILFAILWSIWHLPLFFIKGYYHYDLLQENIIYAINFFISVVPMTIITNWIYYSNNRSMITAMVFHAIVVVSSEMFLITNSTKCIETIVLIALSIIIIQLDKRVFGELNEFKPYIIKKA
jgi:CAAX amino terminal protease family.